MSLVPVRLYYRIPNFPVPHFPWDVTAIVLSYLDEFLGDGLCFLNHKNTFHLFPVLSNLAALELPRAPITNHFLQSLSELRALTLLNVTQCSAITDEGIQTLSALVALQVLHMGDGLFLLQQAGVRSLSLLGALNTLKFHGEIDQQAVPLLASLTSLTWLDLAYCSRLTDNAVQSISALTLLTSLALNGCRYITNQAVQSLSVLTSLTNLDLAGCKGITGNVGVQSLSVLNLLNTLHLPTRINDSAVLSLSTLTALTTLRLSGCKLITDQAVNSLTALTSLTTLDLTGCTSTELIGHWDLSPLTALTSISLLGCHLVPFATIHLRSSLPRLRIEGVTMLSSCVPPPSLVLRRGNVIHNSNSNRSREF